MPEFLDEIQLEHEKLQANVLAAEAERAYWSQHLETPFWEALRAKYEELNQLAHLILEDAKGDDVKRLQAEIKARKQLLAEIDDRAGNMRVEGARQSLERFRIDNQLFVEGCNAAD